MIGVKNPFVTGGGANVFITTGGLPVTLVVLVGVVPFNACKTGKARCKSSRNVTRAWNVGGSRVNIFVPIIIENEVCCCAPAPVAAPVGVSRLDGFDVMGTTAPVTRLVGDEAAELRLVVRNERTGNDSSTFVCKLNKTVSTSLSSRLETFVTCTRELVKPKLFVRGLANGAVKGITGPLTTPVCAKAELIWAVRVPARKAITVTRVKKTFFIQQKRRRDVSTIVPV